MTFCLFLEENLGSFLLINFLSKVHVILKHALSVLISKRVFAYFDNMILVKAWCWSRNKRGTPFMHRIVHTLSYTMLQDEVVHLFLKVFFHVFDLSRIVFYKVFLFKLKLFG